ncbi:MULTISPECIES: hypothetical protein [Hyphomicrobiales]|uniref:Uncharacterized protein n=1 Tax=Microvirga tunisiensis TaxID=2108360 RepID=A0A5N7MQF7_9HYPH|nr:MULTISPECIES: hypothetical protein [Hyphomicrobiales]MPR10137.1 hypothetical protein [Microvirga tunisiensis]MPR28344.1 hypothetical protein [Microvirga tunisiensis]
MDDLQALKAAAARQVAHLHQYDGMFTNYVTVKIKHEIRTKMGLAFAANEIAIAEPTSNAIEEGPYAGQHQRTVWSMKNQVNTTLFETDLEVLQRKMNRCL